jgi:hypothetical protein
MSHWIETMTTTCRECGLPVEIPKHMWNRLAVANGTFVCPNGHAIRPKAPTDIAQLKEQITTLTAELAESQRRLGVAREERDGAWNTVRHLRHVNAALRGYIGRLKKGET